MAKVAVTTTPRLRIVCDLCRKPVDGSVQVIEDYGATLRVVARCHGATDEMTLPLGADLYRQLERQVGHAFTQSNPQLLTKGACGTGRESI